MRCHKLILMFVCGVAMVALSMSEPVTAEEVPTDSKKSAQLDAEQVLADGLKRAKAEKKKVLIHLGAPS